MGLRLSSPTTSRMAAQQARSLSPCFRICARSTRAFGIRPMSILTSTSSSEPRFAPGMWACAFWGGRGVPSLTAASARETCRNELGISFVISADTFVPGGPGGTSARMSSERTGGFLAAWLIASPLSKRHAPSAGRSRPDRGASRADSGGTSRRRTTLSETAAERLLRSEEHTSELQSRPHLVCRLLLEKKKQNTINHILSKKKKKTIKS